MPRNGSGAYTPPVGTFGVSGTVISSSAYDGFINDLSTEVTNSVNVQGTAPMLASLNMGTFSIINAADPVSATDVATKEYVDNFIPAGMIAGFAANITPPSGNWIACQGYSLSTTSFARLFAAIGYSYGGSGANFNVPDFRGCFLRGFDNGRGLDFQGERNPGAYQASYLINHFHAVGDPGHAHGVSDPSHLHGATTGGHGHGTLDPTHNHSQSPHGHSTSDPGHVHSVPGGVVSGGSGLAGGSGFNLGGTTTGNSLTNMTINSNTANINPAGTGVSIVAVGNLGVTVSSAFTGIGINAALTGVLVGSVSTGNVDFSDTETTVQNYPILWCIKY